MKHDRNVPPVSEDQVTPRCSYDSVEAAIDNMDWAVINKMDVGYRAMMAERVISKHAHSIRVSLSGLYHGVGDFYRIIRPGDLYDGHRDTAVSLQMGYMELLSARPLAFLEGSGRIDRPVKPVEGHENRQSTTGTRKFGPHIDHSAARFTFEANDDRHVQPDWLALTTITNPNKIGTLFADPREVANILTVLYEEEANDLERPEASMPTPPSVEPAQFFTNIPVIVRDAHGVPSIRAYPRVLPETERMERALKVLDHVLNQEGIWTEIALEPGETVIARGTALHKRGAVTGPRELTAMYGRDKSLKTRTVCEALPWYELV